MNNPTPCRIVLYHFTVRGDDDKPVSISRPAVVTSVGASDDVVSLYVFFEPRDSRDLYHPPEANKLNVHPFDPSSPNTPGWSWPPRS